MMKSMKRIRAFAAVALCLVGLQASAADIDGIVFADDANIAKPAELGSGWYIRGELGLNLNGLQDVSIYGNPVTSTYLDNNYTDAIHYSANVGYRFNNFLRMEAGLGRLAGTDYTTSRPMYEDAASAFLSDPLAVQPGEANPCNGWGPTTGVDSFITDCISNDTVEYDVVYGMTNVYADFGKFYGFSPFVGAGIGIGRVSWREELNSVDCTPVDASVAVEGCREFGDVSLPVAANQSYSQPGTVNEGVNYRLGWSVTAGLGYDINPNTTVELAYRYMNFGSTLLSTTGTTGSGLSASGYGTHQVNLGLRYAIW